MFAGLVTFFLWATVLFANFAEAMAEGRGKAQAASLRKTRTETMANRRRPDGTVEHVPSSKLDVGDECVVTAGEVIPSDGDVIEGIASVDESAITGESAPVVRESGGDRSAVTGGTRVLSDEIVVRITAKPGETFLDRMIALVEGANRQKTPNEIALSILLAGLTIIFFLAVASLQPFAIYAHAEQKIIVLVALLVCLIPTTIGGLLSAIGIAGMDRLVQHNVLAMSGRAVEAAGDVSTLLLDKTGTITIGNREATRALAGARRLGRAISPRPRSSRASPTRRPKAARSCACATSSTASSRSSPTTRSSCRSPRRPACRASTRRTAGPMGGASNTDPQGRGRQRAPVRDRARRHGSARAHRVRRVDLALPAARRSSSPRTRAILGVIHLKDIVKPGLRERFDELRRLGIRTVMITGDNPLTAAAIAEEAGLDGFLAEATPEDKLALIQRSSGAGTSSR